MPARLIESLATTEALAELFSDKPVLQALLDFEVALARAQARLGIVPQTAVDAIAAAAQADAIRFLRRFPATCCAPELRAYRWSRP